MDDFEFLNSDESRAETENLKTEKIVPLTESDDLTSVNDNNATNSQSTIRDINEIEIENRVDRLRVDDEYSLSSLDPLPNKRIKCEPESHNDQQANGEFVSLAEESELNDTEEDVKLRIVIESYKYPHYLIRDDPEVFNKFKTYLVALYNVNLILEPKTITIEMAKPDDDDEFDEEKFTKKVHKDIKKFTKQHFSRFEMSQFEANGQFEKLRNKAIELFSKSEQVFLSFKNRPNEFLRIEGQKKLVEESKNKLLYSF
jgi:hypothetical protein